MLDQDTPTAVDEVDLALARSVLYRTLALSLSRPSAESVQAVTSDEARAALPAAARLLDECESVARARGRPDPTTPRLAPAVDALLARAPETLGERRRAYNRLFGHAHAPVPPFETEYAPGGNHGQPQRLADIAGYYLAFGLRPATRLDERVDHVACLCEFMDFLARKEALLLSTPGASADDREQLGLVRAAGRSLFRDHLGRFGPAFATRLSEADAGGFYADIARVALHLLERDAQRLRVPHGPPSLELARAEDEAPMACGVPEAGEVPG